MEKNELRRLVRQRRRELSPEELDRLSDEIFGRVRELAVYRNCRCVFLYMSMPGELQTGRFLCRIREEGKRTAVPKVRGRTMTFWHVDDRTALRPGAMNIQEPLSEGEGLLPAGMAYARCADEEEDALVIMPGLAFDTERHRIGYGGGYYDRYLSLHRHHVTVAAAGDFQIFDGVPFAAHDYVPDILVTESRIVTVHSPSHFAAKGV